MLPSGDPECVEHRTSESQDGPLLKESFHLRQPSITSGRAGGVPDACHALTEDKPLSAPFQLVGLIPKWGWLLDPLSKGSNAPAQYAAH